MTLSLDVAPELDMALRNEAEQRGQSATACALELLAEALREADMDRRDLADAERIMAHSDPAKRRTLDELRAAVRGL